MTRFKCIKSFSVPRIDENGTELEGMFDISKGEIWHKENEWSDMLTRDDGAWLDVDKEHWEDYFEEVRMKNETN